MRRGAIFDLDGTLLRWPSSETRFVAAAILGGHPWAAAAGRWAAHIARRGFRDNKAYYAGLPESEAADLAEICFETQVRGALFGEICNRLESHLAEGDVTGILTGAPQFLVEPIGRYLGVDFVAGTELTRKDGMLTGGLARARPYGQDKVAQVREVAEKQGFRLEDAAAYGNEMADRFLLGSVARPVAVNPVGRLWRLARMKGWQILSAY